MRDDEIDDLLSRADPTPNEVDPHVLDRIAESIRPSMQPVRPLPSQMLLSAALFVICAAIALAGAAKLGLAGLRNLSALQRVLIFPSLALLMWFAAISFVSERIPGALRRITPARLLIVISGVLVCVFATVFQDYTVERFVAQGITCLIAGLAHVAIAALLVSLVLRRGFAVDPRAAGLAAGSLAGLAGVAMLELHCANFEAPHVMIWHTAVIWVAAAAATIGAQLLHRRIH